MLRARAPVGQGLEGPWLLDGHEAFPLQALEHRERRRQQFTLLAVVPTPTCDRRLDGGDQELGRRPSVTRFHRRAADPGSRSFRSRRSHPRQQGPQQPTRSGRSLFPATPMISGAAIAVGYRLRREVDPSESRLNRDACPKPTSVFPPTSLSHAAAGGTSGTSGVSSMLRLGRQREPGAINANGTPASVQPIAFASSLTAQRYLRISSARACRVASGSPASNSVMTITRCRRSSSSLCPLMTSLPIK